MNVFAVFSLRSLLVNLLLIWYVLFDRIKWKNERGRGGEAYKPTDVEHLANIVTHGASRIRD